MINEKKNITLFLSINIKPIHVCVTSVYAECLSDMLLAKSKFDRESSEKMMAENFKVMANLSNFVSVFGFNFKVE